jgi:ABC-type lipoprotein release transport system permease subunit
MMFIFALKNIFFYRGRSITTFILTALSTLLLILYVSLMDGSHNSILQSALNVYGGAIEIYHKDYRDIGGNEYLIRDIKTISKKLENIEGIKMFSPRYEAYGLLSFKENSSAALVVGINPQKEQHITQLKEALRSGVYLDDNSQNCLYMGSQLVKRLKINLNQELSFISSASDNAFVADIFKLCGIFQTGAFEFDATTAFISKKYFDILMNSKNSASYISIQVDNLSQVDTINEKIIAALKEKNLESLTWKTLMKTMVEAMEVDSIFGYISLALFGIVIFFVIMIYSFINVSSRIKEFGVLRCIGVSNRDIFRLLLYEIVLLSSTAIIIATPIAGYICYYFSIHPIIIEGMSEMYKDYGIVSDAITFDFSINKIFINVVVIYLLNLISIVYPFFYITALSPIKASHHV